MSLADPQVITVNAVAKSMPRILSEGTHSLYQMADLTYSVDVRHTPFTRDKKKRVRSLVVFSQRTVVADPLTAINDYETVSISFQIDRPEIGFTATQIDQMRAGLATWLDTTMIGKLFGREA